MTDRMLTVQGRCPACGWASLFLGDGGHVTCSRLECPKPEAADELLAAKPAPAPADDPLRERLAKAIYRSHWPRGRWEMRPEEEHDAYREHADAVLAALHEHLEIADAEAWCKTCRRVWESRAHRCESDAEKQLAALRAVARGYCPACGRGDAAPTAADWERERQRADRAEAAIERVRALAMTDAFIMRCDILAALQPAAHDGPTVRECAEVDRRWWNGEKAGE